MRLVTIVLRLNQSRRKWEIPRHWLVIDSTLGEGEFGKVVRASVTFDADISGIVKKRMGHEGWDDF